MAVTDPLRAEHAELRPHLDALDTLAADLGRRPDDVSARIGRLAESAASAGSGEELSDEHVDSLRAQLYGLSAILHLHFAKEEEVLLPILSRVRIRTPAR